MRSGNYDKAKWHFGGEWPEGLPQSQAFVHTGFYLGWLVDRGLVSAEFEREMRTPMLEFCARRLSGPKLFEECDGVLGIEMLTDEGNAFSSVYYDAPIGFDSISGRNHLADRATRAGEILLANWDANWGAEATSGR